MFRSVKSLSIVSTFSLLVIFIEIVLHSQTVSAIKPMKYRRKYEPHRDPVHLIASRGFLPEVHHVVTEDGYILVLHRITSPLVKPGKPIVLMHGLLESSGSWLYKRLDRNSSDLCDKLKDEKSDHKKCTLANGENILAFELAHLGYDVWLPNTRGNEYSRSHIRLNPKSKSFWEFSTDHIIWYDSPAIIDYVLNSTQRKILAWVGHSQGSAQIFGLMSVKPRYNDLVQPFVSLAPVAEASNLRGTFSAISTNFTIKLFKELGGGLDLKPFRAASQFCVLPGIDFLCSFAFFSIAGFDELQMDSSRVRSWLVHAPSGGSLWNLAHFGQNIRWRRFARFDFLDRNKNLLAYGSEVPPEYPLERITNKYISLVSGVNDYLSSPADIDTLRRRLKVPILDDYVIPFRDWNHWDFLWARDVGIYVNSHVIKLIEEFA